MGKNFSLIKMGLNFFQINSENELNDNQKKYLYQSLPIQINVLDF
jgi:hypothetical protein